MKNRHLLSTGAAGFVLGIAILFALTLLWLTARPASGHEPSFDLDTTCGTYTLTIDLIADLDDPQDHRVLVTRNDAGPDVIIDRRDTLGSASDHLPYLTTGGALPVETQFKVWVFDRVDGVFVYGEDAVVGAIFDEILGIGDNGLHAYDSRVVREDYSCTPTPVPTATPEPTQEPTSTAVVVTATPTATSTPEPTATSTPVVIIVEVTPVPSTPASGTGTGSLISPPNTGSAGLR